MDVVNGRFLQRSRQHGKDMERRVAPNQDNGNWFTGRYEPCSRRGLLFRQAASLVMIPTPKTKTRTGRSTQKR